jgi:hypothetical protein
MADLENNIQSFLKTLEIFLGQAVEIEKVVVIILGYQAL